MTTGETIFNMWSVVLKKKYTKNYNLYFDYLIQKKFIMLVSNYYVGKKSKTYKINIDYVYDVKRCNITDKILLKKYSNDYLNQSFLYFNKSPIDVEIRTKLVEDLKHIQIDYDKSIECIKKLKKEDYRKYIKNYNSIDSIKTKHIFFKFDKFGRMHTNFTILKKEIRNNFLKIDGEEITEIDIKNSQPFFFTKILKEEIGVEYFNDECFKFVNLVNNGLIYDYFKENIEFLKSRNDAKLFTYKVLFGTNNLDIKENFEFKRLFPTIFNYLVELKSLGDNYKEMSHSLQKIESEFVFGVIVKKIKEKYPHIRLFTVHDSILFPKKYKTEINLLFNNIMKNELID
jgi:hypothetical protein